MEDTLIVIMLKNNTTGFLETEIDSYNLGVNENLVVNAYAMEQDKQYKIYLKISTDRDVEDWEFNAIYDYYDGEAIKNLVNNIYEVDDCYNPTWEVVFDFIDSHEQMEQKLNDILNCHKNELIDVYETIKDKKDDYTI